MGLYARKSFYFFPESRGFHSPPAVRQRRARCHKQIRVVGEDYFVVLKVKRYNKTLSQLGKIMERTAKKCDLSPYGLSAGQAAYGLIHHRLEHRGGYVAFFRSIVQKRLNIGFCEYAAAGGDGINGFRFFRQLV